MIDLILEIESFEQQCFIIKGWLQSERLKEHVFIIVFDQSLSNSAMYQHRFLENINNLYKNAIKCDYRQQYKAIIEAAIFSIPEVFVDDRKQDADTTD